MNNTETLRNQSYHLVDKKRRQIEVLHVISMFAPITNREISEKLHLPINSITGRVKELRELGLVEFLGKKYDDVTERTVSLFGIKNNLKK